MKITIYTLQSGFMGIDSGKLIRTEKEDSTLSDMLHRGLTAGRTDVQNFYDVAVESIFQRWHRNETLLRDFSFREEIILAAFRCFGMTDLSEWVAMQMSAPTVGSLHRRFLADTFRHVVNKEPRKMECYTYYRLLNATDASRSYPSTNRDHMRDMESIVAPDSSLRTDSVVADWTNSVEGAADLLNTLQVIFGRRRGALPESRTVERA